MTAKMTTTQALQDLQDQIDAITFSFASSISPRSINANAVNASSLQTLTSQTGALTVNTGGSISSGQTGYNTGTGFFLGTNGGTAQMSVGNPGGNHMTWDGTNLTITGNISATTGTIGGWTIGASTLTGGDVVLNSTSGITLTSSGSYGDVILWKNSGGTSIGSITGDTTYGGLKLWGGTSGTSTTFTVGSSAIFGQSADSSVFQMNGVVGGINMRGGASGQGTTVFGEQLFVDGPIFPGASGSQQSTGSITWDSSHSAIKFTGAPVELDHALYPATTANAAQNSISLQVNAGFGLQINGSQIQMTGAASTSILNVTTCTLANGSPTASLPAGVAGLPVFLNGVSGHLAFYT